MSVIMVPGSFPDIQSAVNAAVPGDEILVGNGVYNEQVTITSKEDISIRADGDGVILDGSGLARESFGFYLVSSANVEISGFAIRKFEKGVVVDGLSNNITISNNTISDIRDDGIKVKADNCQVIGNTISKCKDDSIKIVANNCSVLNNNIIDSGEEGIEINGDGNLVRQNTVNNCLDIGIETTGNNNAITENTVKNSTKSDFSDSGTNNTIANNTL